MAANKLTFLRISYWTGAVFDAIAIIPMLSAKVAGMVLGISKFNPGNDFRYAMSIAASLMAGWVFLLVWADRKPLERKGVLLLTIFPVLVGLIFSGVLAVKSGFTMLGNILPMFIMQGLIVILFGFSYLNAKD